MAPVATASGQSKSLAMNQKNTRIRKLEDIWNREKTSVMAGGDIVLAEKKSSILEGLFSCEAPPGACGKKARSCQTLLFRAGCRDVRSQSLVAHSKIFPIMDNVVYPSCGYESASTLLSGAVRLAFAQQGSRLDIGGGQGIMVETVLAR